MSITNEVARPSTAELAVGLLCWPVFIGVAVLACRFLERKYDEWDSALPEPTILVLTVSGHPALLLLGFSVLVAGVVHLRRRRSRSVPYIHYGLLALLAVAAFFTVVALFMPLLSIRQ